MDNVYGLAVSGDGTTLIWAGNVGASSSLIEESFDGGVSWSRPASPCSGVGGWYNVDVQMNANKDKLLTCIKPLDPKIYVFKKPFGGAWGQTKMVTTNGVAKLHTLANGSVLGNLSSSDFLTSANFGSTWTSLTPPTAPVVAEDAEFNSILDEGGNVLFAVGSIGTSVGGTGVIYKSLDAGNTWSLDYSVNPASSNFLNTITKSQLTGTLVAAGRSGATWQLYRNTGAAWVLSQSYTPPSSTLSFVESLVSSSTGNIYASGRYLASGVFNWHTRISTDNATSWSDFDTYQYAAGKNSGIYGSTVHGSNFYGVGYGIGNDLKYHWLVRKYDGSSWSIEDDDTITATATSAIAKSILVSSDGYIYVAGTYTDNGLFRWLVKRKPVSGGAWEISDLFNLSALENAEALSLAEDSLGRIFVSGYAKDSDLIQYALVRMKRTGGSWYTVDKYINAGGLGIANGVVPCLSGRLCISGSSQNAEAQVTGFVRRLSP